jgi:hypothetical protein
MDRGLDRFGAFVERAIVGFHKDEEGHWVADLECGHTRHVRHDPPWQSRPWVITDEGRARFLGTKLRCVKCERGEPIAAKSTSTHKPAN